MTKQEIIEMYRSYLAEEGYVPQVDADGDVTFKCGGWGYFIAIDEDDAEFFRLACPNIWQIESESEGDKVMRAALHATTRTKVVKVLPVRDNTWASVEMFCSSPETFYKVFQRSLRALQVGVQQFRQKMEE